MKKLEKYKKIMEKLVKKYAQYKPNYKQIETLSICDKEANNYLLMNTGWDAKNRVYTVILHLRIVQGKVWVEWDGSERGITEDLLDLGVLREDIVLGFIRPEQRQFSDFSAA